MYATMNRARDAFWIALLASIAYLPSLGGGFVYDDVTIVAGDVRVERGDLLAALTGPYWAERPAGLYRPVTTASYVIEGWLSKAPLGFRLVNVALHAAGSVLALALALRLTGTRRGALIAAGLFAVHPIHVEVAANVVGRAESLGFLLAGCAWLLAVEAASELHVGRLLAACALATLAALAKENALAVAFAAPLEALIFARRRAALAALPGIVAAVTALVLRRAALGSSLMPSASGIPGFMNPLALAPFAVRLANAPLLVLTYVRHLVLPIDLAPDYGGSFLQLATGIGPRSLAQIGAALGLLAIPPLASGRRGLFASAFFVLALLPVLQLVPIGTILADRLAYAASFGFALAVSVSWARPSRRVAAVAFALLASIAANDALAWTDMVALFERGLGRAPGSVQIPYVLGQVLGERARREEDEGHPEAAAALAGNGAADLARAAELAPSDPRPLLHLGVLEHQRGRLIEARRALERALDLLTRQEPVAPNELGFVLAELGFVLEDLRDTPGAEALLARSNEVAPNARVLAELGGLLARRGDSKGARAALARSLALDPTQDKAREIRALLESLPPD
jgi:tetratricopeptide (TPR) repeat protein